MNLTRTTAALLALTLPVAAQQPVGGSAGKADAAAAKLDPAAAKLDALHTAMTEANKKFEADSAPLFEKMRAKDTTAEERKKLSAEVSAMNKAVQTAHEAFDKAFAAADWQHMDPKTGGETYKDGLRSLAFDSEVPDRCEQACKLYAQHFADDEVVGILRGRVLPNALLANGKIEAAEKTLAEAVATGKGSGKVQALLLLGDIAAAKGDRAGASKQYEAAAAENDKDSARYIEVRKELIGKPAPDVDAKSWLGGTAQPLSKLKGHVVLVDFWATWCPPCRAVMPKLDEMYKAHSKDGLVVLGVTKFYNRGSLPANAAEMRDGGESVTGLTEATFPAHVEAFRKNTGISYPFAFGSDADFKAYHVMGIPTLAVVDQSGTIALIAIGSGSEALLKLTVERLLAAGNAK